MIYHNEEKYHRGIKTYPAMRYSGKRDETWYESMVKADKLEDVLVVKSGGVTYLSGSYNQRIFLYTTNI